MKKRIEIYTDTPARLWADAVSYARGEIKYDSRADATGGFDLSAAARRSGEAVKLRVRDLGTAVSFDTYAMLREACLSASTLYDINPDSIFLRGPARGIDVTRLRGEVALDIDTRKQAVMTRAPRKAA